MLDLKEIRRSPKEIEAKLKTKDPEVNIDIIIDLDTRVRDMKTKGDSLKSLRNEFSKKIGEMKRRGEDTTELMHEVSGISDEAHAVDQELTTIEKQLENELAKLPNIPMDDIKVALDPKDNVVIKTWGEKPSFDFKFKNHLELNDTLKLFDFERGSKISGAGWPVYRNMGARLEWALINYMIETHIKNGFMQWMPPLLVREEILFGSGQLPKFAAQQFRVKDDDFNLWLIPTAEVPLNGLHFDEILDAECLPLKYMGYSPCFRREAGAAGKQERGLIRMHQFNKVEMFCFTKPEESAQTFEWMMSCAEEILQGLGIHYRNMLLVTGDMSFASARTVDIEVWLPGQDRYYEVSSVSNCTDYQARRSNTRFRSKQDKPEFVHTLNGSGLATSRLMVALLENNQNADGTVRIPTVLQKYLGGQTVLKPEA